MKRFGSRHVALFREHVAKARKRESIEITIRIVIADHGIVVITYMDHDIQRPLIEQRVESNPPRVEGAKRFHGGFDMAETAQGVNIENTIKDAIQTLWKVEPVERFEGKAGRAAVACDLGGFLDLAKVVVRAKKLNTRTNRQGKSYLKKEIRSNETA